MNGLKRKLTEMAGSLRTLGFDVQPYSDRQLSDAILGAAPEIHDEWPSDDEARRAFEGPAGSSPIR